MTTPSGIKSVIETQIITPLAKAKLEAITFFSEEKGTKTKTNPNKVDKPEQTVSIKAITTVSIMYHLIKYML